MAESKGSSYDRLPLWQTIRLSYATYFAHFSDVLRISVMWLALTALFDGATGWVEVSWMSRILANPQAGPNLAQPVEMTLLNDIGSVVMTLAALSIAVAWHRLLLLDERPGRSGGNIGTRYFWLYVAAAVIICLIAILPCVAVLLPAWLLGWLAASSDEIEPQTPYLVAAGLIAYALGIALLLRLSLLLPACAIGDLTLTMKDAWRSSRRNVWRLFWGIVACTVPPTILVGLIFVGAIMIPLGDNLYRAQWAAAGAVGACGWLITWPLWIGFLSYAFRYLVRRT
jgi:hypothetical protein